MNSPARVIGFVNAAHFIDHYSMLIFAAAVIVMGPALGMAYSELLPYATPGFIAFGAGLLSFLSPCVLPLIPSYVTFITGLSLEDVTKARGQPIWYQLYATNKFEEIGRASCRERVLRLV